MSARGLRLFVALDLPEDTRDALADWADQAAPTAIQRVPRRELHVTLAFLGQRDEGDVPAVAELLGETDRALPALRTTEALWLPPRRPGVLTAALADEPALSALRAGLVTALGEALGWTPERRGFRPHVTVGRVPRGLRVPAREPSPPLPALSFRARALTLYRSHSMPPSPTGSRYEALSSQPLSDS